MFASFFNSVIYVPIYNALAFVVSWTPGGDLGVAIIVITIVVRLILFPVAMKAIKTQIAMRELDPRLKAIRESNKGNNEKIAKETMALFKEYKVNPFASFLLILIQLPIIFGLYFVFLNEAKGLSFDPALLYSFVHAPTAVSSMFLGILDLTGKSIVLALLVAVTQYLYARMTIPAPAPASTTPSLKADFGKSMQFQMRYVFPIVLGVVSYFATSAVALYFATSNVFMLLQELAVRKIHSNGNNKTS